MPGLKFKEALELIEKLTNTDKQHKSIHQLLIETGEELGEFCRAYSIETKAFGKAHKTLDEPAHCEAVDLIICAYALQFCSIGKCATPWYPELIEASEQFLGPPDTVILHAISLLGKGSDYISKPQVFVAFMDDLTIVATTLYRLSRGNEQELPDLMLKKLRKWENNQENE